MILRTAILAIGFLSAVTPVSAEPYSPWGGDEPAWDRPSRQQGDRDQNFSAPVPQKQSGGEAVRDGGPRPDIAPRAPPVVAFNYSGYSAGSIVIDSGGRKLYFILPGGRAFQYPISVGREGFAWAGTEQISRKQPWPDWFPPAEMRQRDPRLPEKMLGGLRNPLGAMALYLGNSLYRIHGTNDEKTIGYASSSGCFRMLNSSVLHLAQFAQIGTSVTVVNSLPRAPEPPLAYERPAARTPPLATNRSTQPLPPVDVPGVDARDENDDFGDDPRYRRAPRDDEEADVANQPVSPRRRADEYDPYARRPAESPFGRDGSSYDPYGARSRYSYDRERSGGRVWYDDERDDN